MLKRCLLIELLAGIAVMIVGALLGGSVLPSLGACMIALAACCSVRARAKRIAFSVGLGVASLLILAVCAVGSFFDMTSLSGYANDTSPLSVLLVLSVVLLGQCFLNLPVEDEPELAFLHRGIRTLVIFSGAGFLGIVLTYLLSYAIYGSAISNYLDGTILQDFHFVEGVVTLAMILTSMREILRTYLGAKQLTEESNNL